MSSSSESLVTINKQTTKKYNLLRWLKYLLFAAICNGAVWGLAITYLKKTPLSFTSEMVIHLAGGSPGVSVNLPSIGQANTSSGTSFGAHSDPRENYKLMATSGTVLTIAAESLEISESQFGKPKVELINNTTLLLLEVSGKEPKVAEKKAWALYQALYKRLNILRSQEQAERDKAVQEVLEDTRVKLTEAQNKVSSYKLQSGFSSSDQITNLIGNIGNLQAELINAIARYREINDSLQQLANTLRLSPQKAADALVLQTDQEFQKILVEYTDATTILTNLLPSRGVNYPDVVEARQKQQASLQALLQRGQKLLGIPVEQLSLERLILDNSNGSGVKRGDLFVQLVKMNADLKGLEGQIAVLKEQIEDLKAKLNLFTEKESIHDNLDRDLQIAQAVFASTLTKIDLSKGDPFASFPMIQIIEEPTLPTEPSAPKPKLVMAGAFIGSLFVSAGLTLLWWREPLLKISKQIVKKAIE
ncbi:MAG: GumC family protein [Pleurocapsa sp.]